MPFFPNIEIVDKASGLPVEPRSVIPAATTPSMSRRRFAHLRRWWWLYLVASIVVLAVVGNAGGPTPASQVPIATQQAMATALANRDRIAARIVFSAHPELTMSTNLEDVAVLVGITNTDTSPHTFTPQANFYRVPLNQLGDDPATFEVTAGYTQVTLAAGQQMAVTIHAKNFNHEQIRSVDFTVTGLPLVSMPYPGSTLA